MRKSLVMSAQIAAEQCSENCSELFGTGMGRRPNEHTHD